MIHGRPHNARCAASQTDILTEALCVGALVFALTVLSAGERLAV